MFGHVLIEAGDFEKVNDHVSEPLYFACEQVRCLGCGSGQLVAPT
jgi:hypothetical protein